MSDRQQEVLNAINLALDGAEHMRKVYDSNGNELCNCTIGGQYAHHETDHRPLTYTMGRARYLTCTRGDLAVCLFGDGDGDEGEVFDQKFAEHLAEVGEGQ